MIKLQFIDGNLYLNDVEILKSKVNINLKFIVEKSIVDTFVFKEKLLNKKEYLTTYYKNGSYQNSDEFLCSQRSLFLFR